MKNNLILSIFLLCLIFLNSFLWKVLSFNNDTLIFVFFLFSTLIPYFYLYKKIYKNDTLSILKLINISVNFNNYNKTKLKKIFFLFLLFLIYQFLILDFNLYISPLDTFHEGLWLTAANNYLITKKFWLSSYIDRGLYGNFFPLIPWKLFDVNTIGSVRFYQLISILFNKILILLLVYQIFNSLNLNFNKKILFIFSCFVYLYFVSYDSSSLISTRNLLSLIFLNFFFYSIDKNNILKIILGFFSATSLLWYLDIGVYINFTILLIIILQFFRREYFSIFFIILGIILSWVLIFVIIEANEFNSFIKNSLNILSTIDKIQGIKHPIPFFSGDSRATKTIIFFIITSVFTLDFLFSEKKIISNNLKIFLFIFYCFSIVSYKTGLSRSDSGHIRTGSGFIILMLATYLLFYSIIFIEKYKTIFNNKKVFFKPLISLGIFILFFLNFDLYKSSNLNESFQNIKKLINEPDNSFLDFTDSKNELASKEYIELLNYYKTIDSNSDCVQIFTDEQALPYLLKKKTCTKFYQIAISQPELIQKELIDQLIKYKPDIILLKSEKFEWNNFSKQHLLNNYLTSNYKLHSKFKFWTFLKRN